MQTWEGWGGCLKVRWGPSFLQNYLPTCKEPVMRDTLLYAKAEKLHGACGVPTQILEFIWKNIKNEV